MKPSKLITGFTLAIIVLAVVLGFSRQTKAIQSQAELSQQANIVVYLQNRLEQQSVPVKQIRVLQNNPLEIEITLQSTSTGNKFASEDFLNLHLATREAVLAGEKGYSINGITTIVLNLEGKIIDRGWIKIEPNIMYIRHAPANLANTSVNNLVREKLDSYGVPGFSSNVSSFDGLQTLELHRASISSDDANQLIPQIRGSIRELAKDINIKGAEIVIVKLKLLDGNGKILLNYMRDLQFETEGWWAADGINIDGWYPSIPAPAP